MLHSLAIAAAVVAAVTSVAAGAVGTQECGNCIVEQRMALPNGTNFFFAAAHLPTAAGNPFFPLYMRQQGEGGSGGNLAVAQVGQDLAAQVVSFADASPTAPAFVDGGAAWPLTNGGIERRTWSGEVTLRESGFPCEPSVAAPVPALDAVLFACGAEAYMWSVAPFHPRQLFAMSLDAPATNLQVVDGVVMAVTSGGTLAAFNATPVGSDAGVPLWTLQGALCAVPFPAMGYSGAAVAVSSAATNETAVYAVDVATGDVQWNVTLTGAAALPVTASAVRLSTADLDQRWIIATVAGPYGVSVSQLSPSGELKWQTSPPSLVGTVLADTGVAMTAFEGSQPAFEVFVCTTASCAGVRSSDGAPRAYGCTSRPTSTVDGGARIRSVSTRAPTPQQHTPFVLVVAERGDGVSELVQIKLQRPTEVAHVTYCQGIPACTQCVDHNTYYTGCQQIAGGYALYECLDQGTRFRMTIYEADQSGPCSQQVVDYVMEFGFTCEPTKLDLHNQLLDAPCTPLATDEAVSRRGLDNASSLPAALLSRRRRRQPGAPARRRCLGQAVMAPWRWRPPAVHSARAACRGVFARPMTIPVKCM